MGMDQYFTTRGYWPGNKDTFMELRNCRAFDKSLQRHGKDKKFINHDFKGCQIDASVIEAIRSEIETGKVWDASWHGNFYCYEKDAGKDQAMRDTLDQCEELLADGQFVYHHVSA